MGYVKKDPWIPAFKAIDPLPTVIKDYKLGRKDLNGTAELVEVGERDFVEMVQSNYASSLDFILDRFLSDGIVPVPQSASKEDQDFLLDALDVSMEYVDMMEEAREMYGLSADLTYTEIREQLQNKLDEIKKTNQTQKEIVTNEIQTNQTSQDAQPQTESPVVS